MPIDPEISPQESILQNICLRLKDKCLCHLCLYTDTQKLIYVYVIYITIYISRELFIAALLLIDIRTGYIFFSIGGRMVK